MQTVSGRENLAQAIVVRLLTPRGELEAVGHPEYGSRLHELIGRENTDTTRNLAKLFILESLAAEPRVEEILDVTVEADPDNRSSVNIVLQVQPVGGAPTVVIGPFTLELEQ
jgi:phage baseplate assembly protein W